MQLVWAQFKCCLIVLAHPGFGDEDGVLTNTPIAHLWDTNRCRREKRGLGGFGNNPSIQHKPNKKKKIKAFSAHLKMTAVFFLQ